MVMARADRTDVSPLTSERLAEERLVVAAGSSEIQRLSDELVATKRLLAETLRLHAMETQRLAAESVYLKRAMQGAASDSARVKGLLIMEINERQEREDRLIEEMRTCRSRVVAAEEDVSSLEATAADIRAELRAEIERRESAEALLSQICSSRSWRWSNGLRKSLGRA